MIDENDPFIRKILEREKKQIARCRERERRKEQEEEFDMEAYRASVPYIISILRACFGEKKSGDMLLGSLGIESAEMLLDQIQKRKADK